MAVTKDGASLAHLADTVTVIAEQMTEPVSYTHLDVYKRQPYGRFELDMEAKLPID